MRWFIVFLIVANVILFFWVQQQSRPLPGSSTLPPPDVGRLRLMSELDEEPDGIVTEGTVATPVEEPAMMPPPYAVTEDQAKAAAADFAQPVAVPDTDLAISDAAPAASEPEPAGQSVEESEAIPVLAGQVSTETDVPVDEVVEAARQSIAQAQQATAETVVQQTAAQTAQAEPADSQPAAIAESAVVDAAAAVCARVGPFKSDDADKLISGLPVYITLLSEVSEEYASVDRYYVLIPPLPSQAAGRQKLKELADAGVTDTWLFPSGEYRNAISLGFFSREGGAKRHAANIAKKGFDTEVKGRTSVRERRWLFLRNADGGDLGSSLPLPEGVAAEQRPCP